MVQEKRSQRMEGLHYFLDSGTDTAPRKKHDTIANLHGRKLQLLPFWQLWAFADLSQQPSADAQEGNGVREAAWFCAKGEMGGESEKVCTPVSDAGSLLQHQQRQRSIWGGTLRWKAKGWKKARCNTDRRKGLKGNLGHVRTCSRESSVSVSRGHLQPQAAPLKPTPNPACGPGADLSPRGHQPLPQQGHGMLLPGAAWEITSHGLLGDVRKETVVAEVLSGEPQPAERWRPLGEAGAARGCPLACHGGPQVTRSSSSLPFPQCVLSGMKTMVEDSLLSHLQGSVVWPARKRQSTQRNCFSLVENAKASEKYKSIVTTNVTKSWLAPFSSELNAEIREAASKVIFR